MSNISALIPYRTTDPHRIRLWAHCKRIWEQLDVELVTGTDHSTGPFNVAAAFNDAACKATGDKFVLYGADHIPDPATLAWADKQLDTHPWVALYKATANYTQTSTEAILNGYTPERLPADIDPFCLANIGIRADAWTPMDERFTGWGSEDRAYRVVLETLYGPTPEPVGTLTALWHEPAPRTNADANYLLLLEYEHARDNGTLTHVRSSID